MASSPLQRNIAANFGGSLWIGLMSLIFIPLYIRFMGMEAYGLVGLFLTLQSLFSLLDLGLGTTLNREFARLSAVEGGRVTQRQLLRTFETVYWCMALLCGIVVLTFAHTIAARWVHPEHLPVVTITHAVQLMGVVIFFQWPFALYGGGLLGVQRQVAINVINVVMATLRGAGAVFILWAVSPTVTAYFLWQVVVSAINTSITGFELWRGLGGPRGAKFNGALLRSVWRFAAGMLGIAVLSTALTQVDKLVVSKVLPLRTLGYYTLAGTVATSLYRLVSPIFLAVFPRFSQLVAGGEEGTLSALYHRTCQAMSVIILPAAIFIAFFAGELLLLWTRDPATALATHSVLSAMVIGTAMNGLSSTPYALQLAYGWTRLALVFNLVAVLVLVPGVYVMATHYGVMGAALGWLSYNLVAVLTLPLLMHRRVLRGQQKRLYLRDIGVPMLVGVVVCALARPLVTARSGMGLIAELSFVALLVQIAVALTMPEVRSWVARFTGLGVPKETSS
jgi:O-antigen/teichoic acid export membrane protein